MTHCAPPVLGFAAYSGTGKTTLLTKLIPLLKAKSLQIGLIKHSHHDFEIDKPGKDSYELRKSGANPVLLVSKYRRAIVEELPQDEVKLTDQLASLSGVELDLILVEGFRHEAFPKIELHRPTLGKPLLQPSDPWIIAVASDSPLATPPDCPWLDLNDTDSIADFILYQFLSRSQ
ncbi:molybdopterin-guanine dinucleotide biosynthesis protein B [Methylomonas koyamae]|uniref:molybdopterin-guanine dinucleotide biosynthesis protein B n=1 Tax=Methylomonas koyamae TaxID=702114 RepID=UPI0011282E51|nr:molybdopterin-guanine dinucleotide biosynthesis protein B [Methylomonas koyamae]TPQ28686.1 molybdopterin-guanine dinucleotide biosynthesis protein B [Methylomonas koyamae]